MKAYFFLFYSYTLRDDLIFLIVFYVVLVLFNLLSYRQTPRCFTNQYSTRNFIMQIFLIQNVFLISVTTEKLIIEKFFFCKAIFYRPSSKMK